MSTLDRVLTQCLRKKFETTRMQLRPLFDLLWPDLLLTQGLRSRLF